MIATSKRRKSKNAIAADATAIAARIPENLNRFADEVPAAESDMLRGLDFVYLAGGK
jgi:hypothetical protein